jgi:hypothetical protein
MEIHYIPFFFNLSQLSFCIIMNGTSVNPNKGQTIFSRFTRALYQTTMKESA